MYIDLLRECLLDSIYGSKVIRGPHGIPKDKNLMANYDNIDNGNYWPDRAHTMVGRKRLNNIKLCFEECIKNNIEGDMIETGVWKGGSTIFMQGLAKYHKQNKKIYVADSFNGLPEADIINYPADKKGGTQYHEVEELKISLEDVKENFRKYDLLDDNVVFIKGYFKDSLKNNDIDKLCILRLDGDMYSSTIQVLDYLYHKVSKGGFIIIDDYGLGGCRKAVDDFRREHDITSPIYRVDWTGVFWKKE